MVLHAGEVFPEWYWGPLFFLIVFSPVLAATAVGADVVVRRLRGPLPLWKRARLWLAAALVATGVILTVSAVRDHLRFESRSSDAAAQFGFDRVPAGAGGGLGAARDLLGTPPTGL